jgi:hypothetical protein
MQCKSDFQRILQQKDVNVEQIRSRKGIITLPNGYDRLLEVMDQRILLSDMELPAAMACLYSNSDTLSGISHQDDFIADMDITLADGHGGIFSFNASFCTTENSWSAPVSIASLPDSANRMRAAATD